MKKIIALSAIALAITLSAPSFAQFQGTVTPTPTPVQGGFKGPTSAITTVAEALKSKDDTNVVLNGKIEKETGKEKYLFKDSTGSITLDIDNDDWHGTIVTPEDTVEVYGEVDKDLIGDVNIDVDRVIKK